MCLGLMELDGIGMSIHLAFARKIRLYMLFRTESVKNAERGQEKARISQDFGTFGATRLDR